MIPRRRIATCLVLLAAVLGSPTAPAAATGTRVGMGHYGARCDGRHDDRPALVAALAAVARAGGGTVVVPKGRCRIVARAGALFVPVDGPVTIDGAAATGSTLTLDTDELGAYRELLRVSGSHVVLRNLTLERQRDAFAVLVKVMASRYLRLDHVLFDGRQNTVKGQDVEGIEFAGSSGDRIEHVLLHAVRMRWLTYGLFQANDTRTTVYGVRVEFSHFSENYGDDLEFNAPNSSMRYVSVADSLFRANRYRDPSAQAGSGVGLANVRHARIVRSAFAGYRYDPVHIEDRASDVQVDRNRFSDSFTAPLDYASMVFVINDSRRITITRNVFDTAANTNPIWCVYAGGGGGTGTPSDLTITGNTFRLRPRAVSLVNYGATNVHHSGNRVVRLR